MARKLERPEASCRCLRRLITALDNRRQKLVARNGHEYEWRRLQYDAVRALVESQRVSVEIHREIIATLHDDVTVHGRLRLASIEFASLLEALHALIRDVERSLVGLSPR